MALIVDPDLLAQGVETTANATARTISLQIAGDLSADGITHQCFYSFWKEEWKTDAALVKFPFPLISIGPEQFEWTEGWTPLDATTRKLLRNGGWKEVDIDGVVQEEHNGVVTLGTFEDDTTDIAYYRKGNDPTLNDTITMTYAGPVNEAIQVFGEIGNPPTFTFASTSTVTQASGDFVADGFVVGGEIVIHDSDTSANDGSWEISAVVALTITVTGTPLTASGADANAQVGWSIRNETSLYLRIRDADPKGKTFDKSSLADIGFALLDNNTRRWGLSNGADQKIDETDANVNSQSPYTQINIKYLPNDFNMDIDTPSSPRAFGIVIDVGTHSNSDGAHASGGSTLTSAMGDIHTSNYDGGTLIIHDGANPQSYTINSTTATTVVISTTFPATTPTDLSFTCQRSSPVVATIQEIYEKVQWSLRQTTNINFLTTSGGVVIGKVADELLEFVGDAMITGSKIPTNPNGGGSGVVILGFDANDTNSLTLTDNVPTEYTFPFVAAGSINFSANLVADSGPAEYWMFFTYTDRTTPTDLATTGSSGLNTTFTGTASLPLVLSGEYLYIVGFTTNPENDGLYVATGSPTTSSIPATKVFPAVDVVDESGVTATMDEDPINSPDAIIVNNNAGSPIEGTIGASSVGFDFDYDNNVQGARAAASDANVTLRAIGHNLAQFIESTGIITRAVGLSFQLTSSLERNYSNP